MALALTRGGESRMDGAPDNLLPAYEDQVDALAAALLETDEVNTFGGDMNLARIEARRQLGAMSATSQANQAAAAQAGADRNRMRASRQGVVPESLPVGAYGEVSGRTVQEANRPLAEAEASLAQEQELADRIIRGYREGQRDWTAEGDYQYAQERGLGNATAGTGQTDLDYRRRVMQRRGQYVTMPDGSVIPVGADPTEQDIQSEREWAEWANETPGTERQALYDPAAYAEWSAARAQELQDRARKDVETYGGSDPSKWTDEQKARRDARLQAENRSADSDTSRELKIARMAQRAGITRQEARRLLDEGREAVMQGRPGDGPLTMAERGRESQSLRDMAGSRRDAELKARRQNRIEQAMLAGGQPTGGPFGTRATTSAINQLGPGWREIAILDRLTNGRVGGPTPLAVEGANAAAAAQMAQQAMVAFLRNNPGATPEQAAAARQQLRGLNPAAAGGDDIAGGQLETPEAQREFTRLAESHDNTYGGMSYDNEMAMANTLQKPPYNLDQATAEELAYRYAEKRRWGTRQRNAPPPEDTGLPPPGSIAPPL